MDWVALHRRGLPATSNAARHPWAPPRPHERCSAPGAPCGTVNGVNDFDQRVLELPQDSAVLEANLSRLEREMVEVPGLAGPVREALVALAAARARRLVALAQLYVDPRAYLVTARWALENARPLLEQDRTGQTVQVPLASAHLLRLSVDGLLGEGAPAVDESLWGALGSWALAVDHVLDEAA